MHITIDCRMWGEKYGGIGRYTKEIVLYLVTHKQWIFILLCSPNAYKDLSSYQNETIRLALCNATIFSLKEQWDVWKAVPRCDLFWSPYMNIPFLKTKAKKQAVTLHDVFHIANPQYYSPLKRIAIAPYYHFSTRNNDLILTVSNFSKTEIKRFFGDRVAAKTQVVYNGCDIQADDVTAKYIGHRYFLFVGSVKPHKNLRNALQGFELLMADGYRFVIVGKKDGFITGDKDIFELVDRINRDEQKVLFTGNITDSELFAWYKGASVLVMPSLYEGFGLPLVEAMHFGLPIVCSDIPIFREICGNKVLFFNPLDSMDISRKMQAAMLLRKPVNYPEWKKWAETAEDIVSLFERFANVE